MLTFNSSKPISPCQFMPAQRSYLKLEQAKPINLDNVLIHTSYVTRPFSSNGLNQMSKTMHNLKLYHKMSPDILVHGPSNPDEYSNFGLGLELLNNLPHKTNIEIPSFSKQLIAMMDKPFTFIDEYLKFVVDNNFPIVLDTAHLHANGLNVNEMITLFEKYKDSYKYIHLNGNEKAKYLSDIHCPITSDRNKILHVDRLLSNIPKDKIIISESPCGDWNYWVNLSKEYGWNLVKFDEHLNY